ncbi:MAG: thrombospondin type 3 repeat-containing protein, partial [Asgard group archaeon]|nr:thrombospondin type 3 repeat-containing protein [Asgard group archaeon]
EKTNGNFTDNDQDGMPDSWENEYGCDPSKDDSSLDYDLDELENILEYQYNCDPNNPDTDGDNFYDGFEVDKGTNPTDPTNHPIRIWVYLVSIIGALLIGLGGFWLIREVKKNKN